MKQKPQVQHVINRLTERALKVGRQPCKLGREPLARRPGMCSVCTAQREFEVDREVARLIDAQVFKGPGICPHRVIASHLAAGLVFSPEAFRSRSDGQYRVDPIAEVRSALKRIRNITRATRLTREDVEALCQNDDRWQALDAVFSAQQALETAIVKFRSQTKTAPRAPRGRIGALHIQAAARSMASAWRVLTGRLPAKDNTKFHALLHAAVATVFGHSAKEPNWESTTRIAVQRLKKEAREQALMGCQ